MEGQQAHYPRDLNKNAAGRAVAKPFIDNGLTVKGPSFLSWKGEGGIQSNTVYTELMFEKIR